jgi:hypothetical protein
MKLKKNDELQNIDYPTMKKYSSTEVIQNLIIGAGIVALTTIGGCAKSETEKKVDKKTQPQKKSSDKKNQQIPTSGVVPKVNKPPKDHTRPGGAAHIIPKKPVNPSAGGGVIPAPKLHNKKPAVRGVLPAPNKNVKPRHPGVAPVKPKTTK